MTRAGKARPRVGERKANVQAEPRSPGVDANQPCALSILATTTSGAVLATQPSRRAAIGRQTRQPEGEKSPVVNAHLPESHVPESHVLASPFETNDAPRVMRLPPRSLSAVHRASERTPVFDGLSASTKGARRALIKSRSAGEGPGNVEACRRRNLALGAAAISKRVSAALEIRSAWP